MERTGGTTSRWSALTTLLGLLLAAVVSPLLLSTPLDGSAAVAAALVALSASLLASRDHRGTPSVRVATVRPTVATVAVPYLSRRVTDAHRSPLRPRAPEAV